MRARVRGRCAKAMLLAAVALALALPAVAGEGEFRRWGVGWHDDPGVRYRTESGWETTLFADWGDSEDESLTEREYTDGDLNSSHYRTLNQSRSVNLRVARQFSLGKGVHAGPQLSVSYAYSRNEKEWEELRLYLDSETYSYDRDLDIDLRESYGFGLAVAPQWRFHPRISIESSFGVSYARSFSRDHEVYYHLDTSGQESESEYMRSQTNKGWSISEFSPSLTMVVGLFFYF